MRMNAAVVAHFDPNDRLEDNFRLMLLCLERVFDIVVLVTTSELPETETAQFKNVITIRRPNIGYDFYSYRVGLSYLYEHIEVGNILLVNSSFVVVDPDVFTQTLDNMLRLSQEHEVVGVTGSQQFNWHLQSYLLLLGNKVFQSGWFKSFFANVQPLNSKLEIILSYEIGLSRALRANGVDAIALFKPKALQRLLAEVRWMRVIARTSGWLTGKPLRHRREVNWAHFCAEEIARQFGFVKTEILRTNPHGISTDFVSRLASPAVVANIQALLDNSRSHYQSGESGLTTLASNRSSMSTSRVVTYGKKRAKGVRVAVVVHLFYYDLLDEICSYLLGIVEPFDLYVTTPFEGDVHKIINRTSNIAHSVTVFLTDNRGRDIGPFVSLLRTGLLDSYTAVLKLHTKRSKYSHKGDFWRREIYRGVLGSSKLTHDIIKLLEQPNVGMVGIDQYYLTNQKYWGADKANVKNLLCEMGVLAPEDEPELGFFAGSMFWFKPKAFSPLKLIANEHLLFEPENGLQDGTLAHAVERIFCQIVRYEGFVVTSAALAGNDIKEIESVNNHVPVL